MNKMFPYFCSLFSLTAYSSLKTQREQLQLPLPPAPLILVHYLLLLLQLNFEGQEDFRKFTESIEVARIGERALMGSFIKFLMQKQGNISTCKYIHVVKISITQICCPAILKEVIFFAYVVQHRLLNP